MRNGWSSGWGRVFQPSRGIHRALKGFLWSSRAGQMTQWFPWSMWESKIGTAIGYNSGDVIHTVIDGGTEMPKMWLPRSHLAEGWDVWIWKCIGVGTTDGSWRRVSSPPAPLHYPTLPGRRKVCSVGLEGVRVTVTTTKENHAQHLCQEHRPAEADIQTKVGDLS